MIATGSEAFRVMEMAEELDVDSVYLLYEQLTVMNGLLTYIIVILAIFFAVFVFKLVYSLIYNIVIKHLM
ncbi:hypothetical protein AALB39_02070 [Lachnospiraceae bacterium 54-53]